jgi:hypothetical protein
MSADINRIQVSRNGPGRLMRPGFFLLQFYNPADYLRNIIEAVRVTTA